MTLTSLIVARADSIREVAMCHSLEETHDFIMEMLKTEDGAKSIALALHIQAIEIDNLNK